jgi:hypothetical protein
MGHGLSASRFLGIYEDVTNGVFMNSQQCSGGIGLSFSRLNPTLELPTSRRGRGYG